MKLILTGTLATFVLGAAIASSQTPAPAGQAPAPPRRSSDAARTASRRAGPEGYAGEAGDNDIQGSSEGICGQRLYDLTHNAAKRVLEHRGSNRDGRWR